ncbi:hypothetical protein DFH09DRAFT_840490, partial [Mycena vulgaris]
LPSEPKIFHGRNSEVLDIVQAFMQQAPRVAILGAGGMGKTSLARAVLHHPEIAARYDQHRVFVACDSTSTSVQLAALIGAHLGMKPGKDLTQSVIQYFSSGPASLLVIDNLETLWEPNESRGDVEKFLSILSDINHLALIITMRGAERPAGVRWTRPFLEPLKPLTKEASRRTFLDITDDDSDTRDIDKLLLLTDNMPLAINLIAHLVDYEGAPSVLTRWGTEGTSLLSEGYDRGSNLDLSISLSLSSPHFTVLPHAQDLLSLLAILPDGLSDVELLQSQFPIDNILACKAALLRTCLAYTDNRKRLKMLVPIREYMQKHHPPMTSVIRPLLTYFHVLLESYATQGGTLSSPRMIARITENYLNIQNVLSKGLT